MFEFIRYFFSWGEDHTKSIINYYPDLVGKVHSAGNSRIDILKSMSKNDYRVKKLKKKYGNFYYLQVNSLG